jgi:hypothetical protein
MCYNLKILSLSLGIPLPSYFQMDNFMFPKHQTFKLKHIKGKLWTSSSATFGPLLMCIHPSSKLFAIHYPLVPTSTSSSESCIFSLTFML